MELASKCHQYLKDKILKRKFEGYEPERASLMETVKQTIELRTANSVFVLGGSGIGSLMVQDVLSEINADTQYQDNYRIIELQGLCHTDDKIAFQYITEKLDYVAEKTVVSYSDELSKFLQNLGDLEIEETLIFILEDFHLFCSHQNQTLLYNLFDNVQYRKVSICVIGIANQTNIIEMLEKRVQSRFSGSQIILRCNPDFKHRVSKFKSLLSLSEDSQLDSSFIKNWNNKIDELCNDAAVIDMLKCQFYVNQGEKMFFNFLFTCVSLLDPEDTRLTADHVKLAFELFHRQSKVQLSVLTGLSLLEFCLLVTIHHHSVIFNNKPFTFETIYQRYLNFLRNASNAPRVPKQIAVQCLEMLQTLHLIAPIADEADKAVAKEFVVYQMLISSQEAKDAIKVYPDLPTEIKEWAENILT